MNLPLVVLSLGGKQTGVKDEFVLNCWLCEGQQKLYFNTKRGVGFCQKCLKRIDLRSLFQEAGIPMSEANQAIEDMRRDTQDSAVSHLGVKDYLVSKLFADKFAEDTPPELPPARMPEGHFLLEEVQHLSMGKKALDYLLNRGFRKKTLFELQFGACFDGFYGGRIIVPFWEHGKIVYWQARDYTGRQELKIRNPFKDHCLVGKSEVLFNYDGVTDLDIIVITESWGSSLATGPQAIGLNGKSLSDIQTMKLLSLKASTFLLLLDPNTETAALKIAKKLADHRKVLIANLIDGDPNEIPRSTLLKAVSEATPYTSASVLRVTANSMSSPKQYKV